MIRRVKRLADFGSLSISALVAESEDSIVGQVSIDRVLGLIMNLPKLSRVTELRDLRSSVE